MTDAELSISDSTLIARLRSDHPDHLTSAAADRIEALIAERDALFRRATLAEEWRDHDKTRAETAEAKLAECEARLRKAVGALSLCAGHDHDCVSKIQIARATLAEIKPITEWPEETGNIMVGKLKGESHE